MKSNQVSILVVLLLCLVMGGFLYVVDRSSDDEKGWNPSELYSELGARSYEGSSFSDVTFSGGTSSDGVAVSMRNGSFSLRTRASRASSLTPNNPIASSPNNLPSLQGGDGGRLSSPNSLIGHMTSSAEFHSFGGGHSGNMGSAMTGMTNSGNVAASFAYSSPSYGVASSGLSSYSPITLLSGTDGTQIMSAEQALISASSSASGLFGSAMQNTYGTASYDQTVYGSNGSKPSGVRGKQNVEGSGSTIGDEWLKWLHDTYKEDEGGVHTFDWQEGYEAYLQWVAECWNDVLGDPPTYEEWIAWFGASEDGYTVDGNTYKYVPVGNVLPLFLMAMLYMIILFVKRNKTAQL